MNNFDLVLLALAGALVVFGMFKGLIRILIGIAALVAAFALAASFHQPLADKLAEMSVPFVGQRLVAYLLIFVGVMLAGGFLARLLRKMVKIAMLGWADRLGGAALGLVAAALISALLVLPAVAYSPTTRDWMTGSTLAPYITVVADAANYMVPGELRVRYREAVEDLRERWREEQYPSI
ncbi:hypothetical protein ABI59_09700 [Acidobacteria bacterium Mor1]|nr:hypothetical protein ABI59_09700 [Acidobacteria bacterium Mor1]